MSRRTLFDAYNFSSTHPHVDIIDAPMMPSPRKRRLSLLPPPNAQCPIPNSEVVQSPPLFNSPSPHVVPSPCFPLNLSPSRTFAQRTSCLCPSPCSHGLSTIATTPCVIIVHHRPCWYGPPSFHESLHSFPLPPSISINIFSLLHGALKKPNIRPSQQHRRPPSHLRHHASIVPSPLTSFPSHGLPL